MEDSSVPNTLAEGEVEHPLAETVEEAAKLAASIERAVQHETGHGVQALTVEIDADGVRLEGHCTTYYCKQLAQHAAMTIPGGDRLTNRIEVRQQPLEENWLPERP